MWVMSQDELTLVNTDHVRGFFATEHVANGYQLRAQIEDGGDIPLGSFDSQEHVIQVIKFVGVCMVKPEDREKLTRIPTREDMNAGSEEAMEKIGVLAGILEVLKDAETDSGAGKKKRNPFDLLTPYDH